MKVDRLVSIIMILLDKQRIGAQALAERFEVSPRTIYRDIDAINLAGVPVRAISGVGGGFEIMPHYKLDQTVFSAADLTALLMGLSSLSAMVRGDEVVHALAKVKRFIPADRAKDVERNVNQIHIDASPWVGNRDIQPYLETMQTAMQESKLLSFAYVAHHGKQSTRTVEPYQLVLKGSHWYLQGYCRMRKDYRLFKLSRMANLQMLAEAFTPRAYAMPQLDATDLVAQRQTEIKLRVHPSILDRVLDFCTYEHLSPDGDGYCLVRFPFLENDYYYSILLSFGAQCQCLEPPHIRAEMRRRIHQIADLYEA